ncbi:serine threonine- kinase Nek5-like isoform X1 [Labeo rohita]|uniref:Serine threonine-kinase Nek5-like isoform X1 n=1 Tax=Labeo rohita TaxID=84645 RepID=A0A498M2U7_LABRO|nr:serine threonine- kinase Nek5-like isoform X1 [Labeo rohita]
MLSCDPKDRPSAEEILAKPFLNDAVNRNSRTPEALLQSVVKSIDTFDKAYNKHFKDIGDLVRVRIGVAVAGGVASGVSNITKMFKERSNRQKVKLLFTELQEKITSTSYCVQNIQIAIETQRLLSESNESGLNAESGRKTLIGAGARLGRGLGGVAELVRLAQVTSAGRIAAQTARVVHVAEVATGVLTGLFVAVDIIFVALDSREIHNLRKDYASTNKKEQELRSEIMKFVNKIRETKDELKQILD